MVFGNRWPYTNPTHLASWTEVGITSFESRARNCLHLKDVTMTPLKDLDKADDSIYSDESASIDNTKDGSGIIVTTGHPSNPQSTVE